MSSGGLVQLHLDLTSDAFLEARYEGSADTTGVFVRQGVFGVGQRLGRNIRITVEDGIARDTRTHSVLHFVAAFSASNARVGRSAY